MSDFQYQKGDSPLIVSMPHTGLEIPDDIKSNMTDVGKEMIDTDWYIDRLYDFLNDMNVTIIGAKYSRYVVDLNRGLAGKSLYPGQNETTLCPTHTFDNEPLYVDGYAPDIAARAESYWRPYHDQIKADIVRLKEKHGLVRLWDAHSIKSHVPHLFDGKLPDLNLGTGNGIAANHALVERLDDIINQSNYSTALNGRFKGGFITRNYGDPENNIDAIQLEISQITYMDEAPHIKFQEARANKLRKVLKSLIETLK
ncbi:MAG: N-formylglutamate deformylase [Emcibacteraceae bacterium]|nr:N-formylglutamate deformylase [Emcibacteraceae bacterium]MDG1997219.1 N-formylglutamate deformylase [Emcibacteraceae bacterium]